MAVLVEAAFEAKFNTSYNLGDISWVPPDPSVLGVPSTVLGDDAHALLMKPAELSVTIAQLDVDGAEGLDGVTNSMIKNAGPVSCDSLLAMFNNVLVSGVRPPPGRSATLLSSLKSRHKLLW